MFLYVLSQKGYGGVEARAQELYAYYCTLYNEILDADSRLIAVTSIEPL